MSIIHNSLRQVKIFIQIGKMVLKPVCHVNRAILRRYFAFCAIEIFRNSIPFSGPRTKIIVVNMSLSMPA